jgi:hypothetical protein
MVDRPEIDPSQIITRTSQIRTSFILPTNSKSPECSSSKVDVISGDVSFSSLDFLSPTTTTVSKAQFYTSSPLLSTSFPSSSLSSISHTPSSPSSPSSFRSSPSPTSAHQPSVQANQSTFQANKPILLNNSYIGLGDYEGTRGYRQSK